MEHVTSHADAFVHAKVLIGLVTGLSITRLLAGLSRFVQHRGADGIFAPHLAWVGFMLLYVIHFWWFEFGLSAIGRWSFPEYAFVLGYAALNFFITTLLFPDRMDDYDGFEDYFMSRRRWFYGLLALVFMVDIADTLLKGWDNFAELGLVYPVRQALLTGLCGVGMVLRRPSAHLALAGLAIVAQFWWIITRYEFLT